MSTRRKEGLAEPVPTAVTQLLGRWRAEAKCKRAGIDYKDPPGNSRGGRNEQGTHSETCSDL